MQTFEGSTFTIEYPKEWQQNSMDFFGMTMAFFSTRQLSMEDLQGMDFQTMAAEDPIAIVMLVPAEMTSDMGFEDIDQALDEVVSAQDENVEIVKQEDTSLGGAKGKLVIAKGDIPDVGSVGLHLAIAKRDDNSVVVLMGISPEKSRDQNLKIFEYMHKSFKFKE
ncbi:MAG: hypothetical protein D6759_04330 [Chloroflexi bacterium]|nr:MAG: hypothetical protein D6759_04330 [Chloroflexota bacterium]